MFTSAYCGKLPYVEYSYYNKTKMYRSPESSKYTCESGYAFEKGSGIVICLDTSEFSPLPICSESKYNIFKLLFCNNFLFKYFIHAIDIK